MRKRCVLENYIYESAEVPGRSLYAQFEASCAIEYEPEHAFVDVRPITRDI